MSLCATCIHNTANDRSVVACVDFDDGPVALPACDVGQPIFPNAERCTMHFEPPIDGD